MVGISLLEGVLMSIVGLLIPDRRLISSSGGPVWDRKYEPPIGDQEYSSHFAKGRRFECHHRSDDDALDIPPLSDGGYIVAGSFATRYLGMMKLGKRVNI